MHRTHRTAMLLVVLALLLTACQDAADPLPGSTTATGITSTTGTTSAIPPTTGATPGSTVGSTVGTTSTSTLGGSTTTSSSTTVAGATTTSTVPGETTTTTIGASTTTTSVGVTSTTTTTVPVPTTVLSGQPLIVGSVLPLSGDLSAFGPGMRNAVAMAVAEANAAGGVNGAPVVHRSFDSGSLTSVAQAAAAAALAAGAEAIVGAAATDVSVALLAPVTGSGVVLVSPANTSADFPVTDGNGYYFRTVRSDGLQGKFLAGLLDDDGVTKAAAIYRQDPRGEGILDELRAHFAGDLVIEIPYEPGILDFVDESAAIAAAGPQAVVCICFPQTGTVIHQSAAVEGLLDLSWYYADGMRDDTFPETAFPADVGALEGFVGLTPIPASGQEGAAFTAAYQQNYGSAPSQFASQAYDAAWLIILAAEAGSGDGASIASHLEAVSGGGSSCGGPACLAMARGGTNLDYRGASGGIDLVAGQPSTAPYESWRFTGAGAIEATGFVGG